MTGALIPKFAWKLLPGLANRKSRRPCDIGAPNSKELCIVPAWGAGFRPARGPREGKHDEPMGPGFARRRHDGRRGIGRLASAAAALAVSRSACLQRGTDARTDPARAGAGRHGADGI